MTSMVHFQFMTENYRTNILLTNSFVWLVFQLREKVCTIFSKTVEFVQSNQVKSGSPINIFNNKNKDPHLSFIKQT